EEQAHAERERMETAGDHAAERSRAGRFQVHVERLRIELQGEVQDLAFRHGLACGLETLPDGEVVEVEDIAHATAPICLGIINSTRRSTSEKRMPAPPHTSMTQ